MHAEAAICLCATVLKYINRRFNLTAVAFIYHSTLQIKVNYLRRQKLGRAKICCRFMFHERIHRRDNCELSDFSSSANFRVENLSLDIP